MSLESLSVARQAIDEADKVLRSEAKSTIQAELEELFLNNPDVQTVSWAQKAGEYNDEGMYPGIVGPVLNLEGSDDDELEIHSDWLWDGPGYELLYDFNRKEIDTRASRLSEVLEAVGEDILSDLYGNENIVIIQRTDKGARVITEYVGC